MTHVNEEIVAQYYELKDYLVRRNLPVEVNKPNAPDSDIDLVAYNPSTEDALVVEVKGWGGYSLTANLVKKEFSKLSFTKENAKNKMKEFFGESIGKFKKVFVFFNRACEKTEKEEAEKLLRKQKIDVIYFEDDILPGLITGIRKEGLSKDRSHSEIQQVIRLLLMYKFIPEIKGKYGRTHLTLSKALMDERGWGDGTILETKIDSRGGNFMLRERK